MQVKSVLMIHGAGGGGWEWAVWSRVFTAAGWRVSTPDLMPSPGGLVHTSLDDYERQVRDWIRSVQPSLIIGASLGGLLALSCAAEVASARLVLVNPMPPADIAGVPVLQQHWSPEVAWQRSASLISTAAALPDADASTWQLAWRRWRNESGAVLAAASSRCGIPLPTSPALMLVSGMDDDVPATTTRALAVALGADVLELGNASHVGPLLGRDAATVATRVLAWSRLRS